MNADDGAVIGDRHDVLILSDQLQVDQISRLLVQNASFRPLAGARLQAVFLQLTALAEAVFGHRQDAISLFDDQHIHQIIPVVQLHAADALGVSPHRADVFLRKADYFAVVGSHHDLVLSVRELHGNQLVSLDDVDREFPHLADAVEFRNRGLLDEPPFRRHDDKAFLPLRSGNDGFHLLPLRQLQQVDDGTAARGARRLRDLVSLDAEYFALVGEEEQVVVRGADKDVGDEILFLGFVRGHAPPAAALRAVLRHGNALDIAEMRHADDDILFFDEVGDIDLAVIVGELRLPGRRILLFDVEQIRFHDLPHAEFVCQNIF